MTNFTLRYFAAARAAAGGIEKEQRQAATPREALNQAIEDHGAELERVVEISSFLLNGTSLASADAGIPIANDAILDVLPPFAGG